MTISIDHYLLLSLFMFSAGVLGILVRRSAIVIFMCIELMLNAANLAFLTFSYKFQDEHGQIMALFVIAIAAAEAAIGLAIIIALFRNKKSISINEINILNG